MSGDDNLKSISQSSSLFINLTEHTRSICPPLDNARMNMEVASLGYNLGSGWEFKQTDTEDWMPVKTIPTNVHLDLMDNDKCVTHSCHVPVSLCADLDNQG